MIINLSPQGRNDTLSVSRRGDVLTINGQDYDLSLIPDGATLPNAHEATGCEFITGDIKRVDGTLHITLILPHGDLPQPQERLFPQPIINPEDGEIKLP